MSCDYCGNNYLMCQNGDMYICEECYGNLDCNKCEYLNECDIYKIKTLTKTKSVEEVVIKFFKDTKVTCVESIQQTDRVMECTYEFLEELYELVENKLI